MNKTKVIECLENIFHSKYKEYDSRRGYIDLTVYSIDEVISVSFLSEDTLGLDHFAISSIYSEKKNTQKIIRLLSNKLADNIDDVRNAEVAFKWAASCNFKEITALLKYLE